MVKVTAAGANEVTAVVVNMAAEAEEEVAGGGIVPGTTKGVANQINQGGPRTKDILLLLNVRAMAEDWMVELRMILRVAVAVGQGVVVVEEALMVRAAAAAVVVAKFGALLQLTGEMVGGGWGVMGSLSDPTLMGHVRLIETAGVAVVEAEVETAEAVEGEEELLTVVAGAFMKFGLV